MKVLLVYWHPEPRSFNAATLAAFASRLGHIEYESPLDVGVY